MQFCLSRTFVACLLVLVGTGITASACRSNREALQQADGARYVLGIEGMTCAVSCAPEVKASLATIPGVKSVEVSFEEKRAVVQMAAGHELTQQTCDSSFGNKGYFVSSLERAEPPATGD